MILQCNNVSKSFGQTNVLKDINLHVDKGEILTLLGDSGCGKSTLLRIIAGLESSDSGEVFIDEKIVQNKNSFVSPQKRGIAFVFQDYALFPHMSVEENIAFALKNVPKDEKQRLVEDVSRILNVSSLLKRSPHELSGGQQQRIAIARALVLKPSILLLDEPFSNLDTNLKISVSIELRELIKSLKIGAIMVTHNRHEALSMSDNIALLNDGIIEQHASPEDIYKNPKTLHVAKFMGNISLLNPKILNLDKEDNMMLAIRPEDCAFEDEGIGVEVRQIIYEGGYKLLKVLLHKTGELLEIRVNGSFQVQIGDNKYIKINNYRIISK